jgi:Helix-turn-helix domain of resolvase
MAALQHCGIRTFAAVRKKGSPPTAVPGGEKVLTVEGWAEIRRLHRAENMPIKAIARTLGVSRNTVRAAFTLTKRCSWRPAGSDDTHTLKNAMRSPGLGDQ